MPTAQQVIEYLKKLPNTEKFFALDIDSQHNQIFNVIEMLKMYVGGQDVVLNERVIALQLLHDLNADENEFNDIKRNGIKRYSVKDVTVEFWDDNTMPNEVLMILEYLNPRFSKRGRVGRLI